MKTNHLRRAISAAILASSGIVSASLCPGSHCDFSYGITTGICDVDCNTYVETLRTVGPSGTVKMSDPIRINYQVFRNCDGASPNYKETISYSEEETIDHTVSGELKEEVALKVGAKDVADLGLTQATTAGSTWHYSDTWKHDTSMEVSGTVPKCKAVQVDLWGTKKLGHHLGSGAYYWSADFRHCLTLMWESISGSCDDTSSQADGTKSWYGLGTDPHVITPNPACNCGG